MDNKKEDIINEKKKEEIDEYIEIKKEEIK